jgi:hypothetical protein
MMAKRAAGQAAAAGAQQQLPNLAAVAALDYYRLYGEQLAGWAEELLGKRGSVVDAEGNPWLLPHDKCGCCPCWCCAGAAVSVTLLNSSSCVGHSMVLLHPFHI